MLFRIIKSAKLRARPKTSAREKAHERVPDHSGKVSTHQQGGGRLSRTLRGHAQCLALPAQGTGVSEGRPENLLSAYSAEQLSR